MARTPALKSQLQNRVAQQLRQLISTMLIKEDFYSEVINNVNLSVTDVDVSPDLKNAKIFIDINEIVDNKQTIAELNKITGYIKKKLSKKLNARIFPSIKFYLDTSSEYSKKINKILSEISER